MRARRWRCRRAAPAHQGRGARGACACRWTARGSAPGPLGNRDQVLAPRGSAELARSRPWSPARGGGRSFPARNTGRLGRDRKSTCLNSSHANISYAVFCLKKKKKKKEKGVVNLYILFFRDNNKDAHLI